MVKLVILIMFFFFFICTYTTTAFKVHGNKSKLFTNKQTGIFKISSVPGVLVNKKIVCMVPSPVERDENTRGIEVSATVGAFFLSLLYLKSFNWSLVFMFLSHYVVQKNSVFGNSLRAVGFIIYAVVVFVADIYNSLKNNIGDDKTRQSITSVEKAYAQFRVNERVQAVFDFTDVSIEKLTEIFDSARKEV